MSTRLNHDALAKLETDTTLFCKIAKQLKIKPASLVVSISRNSRKLTDYRILQTISTHTGIEITDLLEEIAEEEITAFAD